jgi:uncharacterized protein YkwD
MIKRLFIVPILLALTLSACSGRGAAPTTPAVTDTLPPTATVATTAAPAITETATVPPVTGTPATPTSGTVAPTNPPDCTNSASFVADVTIPDNSNIAPGTLFTKTWRIANKGTCVWGPTYKLVYYSEERMGAPDSTSIPITYPGQTSDISINLTSPTSTGKHQANFVIKNSAGAIVKIGDDSRLWTVINVTIGGAAPTSAVTATATSGANTSSTLVPATLPAATVPAATVGSPSPDTASCLYTIDQTKLMEVINAVNAYRAQKSLPAYTVNPKLAQAAQLHASDMACNHLFVHTGSDGSTPQTRVAATGYVALDLSENVYGSYPPLTGQDVVNWWMNDKTDVRHNENLLSTTFTEIGVGYSFFENYGYYVIDFAKP